MRLLKLRRWFSRFGRPSKQADPEPTDPSDEQFPDYARRLAHGAFHELNPVRRAWAMLQFDRGDIWVILIYTGAIGSFALAVPITVQSLVNTVAFAGLRQPLFVLTTILAVALIIFAVLRTLQFRVVEMLQRRFFVRIVAEINQRLPHVEMGVFQTRNGPELLNRFFDIFAAQKSLSIILVQGVDAVLFSFVGLVVLAFYHPLLLAFDIILIAFALIVFFGMGRGGIRTAVAESKAKYSVAGWLQEVARHPVLFKLHAARPFAEARTTELAMSYLRRRERHFRIVYRQFIGALATQVVASVALLALGGMLVIDRQLTLGQLVAAELIVNAVLSSIAKLGNKIETYYDLMASVDKIGQVLDVPLEPGAGEANIELDPKQPLLEADELELYWEGQADPPPATSFKIPRGQHVHLHGLTEREASGLGDIIFGLRQPHTGMLRLGGHDYRDISLNELRAHVAVVRAGEILPGTIAENVRAANPNMSSAHVWHALQAVTLEKVIRRLPEGINTELGSTGTPLSYGESLCLSIARVLASRPTLLVLERVFDRLPPAIHSQLAASLSSIEDTTIVAISENPSLYQWCDWSIDLRTGNSKQLTKETHGG